MNSEQRHFAESLIANTKTHAEWLTVVRFGLDSLVSDSEEHLDFFITVLLNEAGRWKTPGESLGQSLAVLLDELDLKIMETGNPF